MFSLFATHYFWLALGASAINSALLWASVFGVLGFLFGTVVLRVLDDFADYDGYLSPDDSFGGVCSSASIVAAVASMSVRCWRLNARKCSRVSGRTQ